MKTDDVYYLGHWFIMKCGIYFGTRLASEAMLFGYRFFDDLSDCIFIIFWSKWETKKWRWCTLFPHFSTLFRKWCFWKFFGSLWFPFGTLLVPFWLPFGSMLFVLDISILNLFNMKILTFVTRVCKAPVEQPQTPPSTEFHSRIPPHKGHVWNLAAGNSINRYANKIIASI